MKRSKFNLSNTKLLSCDMGQLVPIGLTEILPGDSFQQSTTCMVRFSPLLAPVMHNVQVSITHWFVPTRVIWEDFEDFITGGSDGEDDSEPPMIVVPETTGYAVGSLADYLGVPPGIAGDSGNFRYHSALPFRAYNLIWNEFFRDQDLQSELVISYESGTDSTTSVALQRVNWEKDYLTSSRPWEQKGPSITLPLGTTAPLILNPTSGAITSSKVRIASTGNLSAVDDPTKSLNTGVFALNSGSTPVTLDVTGSHVADLSNASAVTVNLLREALALQRFEEARARFGSRYVEYLRYLGVRSSDARLQRPEYLGGGRYPVQFSEVLQTAEGDDPVGELRGHGIGVSRSNRYRRFFEEHGYVLTLMSVRPKTIYATGLHRMWKREFKEAYFQKELQHIGQQEVKNIEVYMGDSGPDDNFGWQDRYDEYRRAESSIAGEFRTTLDFWHFARQFTSDVALNSSFVTCTPSEEPFAVPSTNTLYVMAKHSIQARRIVAASGQSFIY